ncbi:Arylsulfatase A [Lutibacter oricola]|uniref:Arylsulfatase A n=1 Tax=Lutibacter oricola TaxID=762486 RepID=A0A1H2SGA4_9FLAO|nr:arylsulfatase [Lutibacter oricola]SDW30666.1 Arylsulfatase A [Lutibacter oricola]
MKNKFIYTVFLLVSIVCFKLKAQQRPKQPNVIFILTDDQGYGDIAAHGNKVIKTPNLDNLHNQSVRLTNYHTGPTCAPSRSGLMSGAYGNRAGVWHTIGGCSILREKFVAMPQVFKENGYATGMFGKWHLGDAYPYLPEDRGFDETVYHGAGGIGQTPDYWLNDYFDDTYFRNGTPEKFKGYCTDVFFEEAIKFIEKKKDQPFFAYISTNAPHGPLNLPKDYYDLYKNEKSITDAQKAFYGMITNIDDNIGILEKKLKQLGIQDDTILIFMTDNGTATGHTVIKGETYGFNAGMRGHKASQYDGGHRVPFFIRWNNGGVNGGVDIRNITMNYDVLPTLIDLCSLSKIDGPAFDGVSLKPLLTKEVNSWPHRYTFTDSNKKQHPKKWYKSAVMDDDWRLIDGKELYNIKNDVGQKINVAKKFPKKFEEMKTAYEKWWKYVSQDFGRYEAYKIGVSHIKETTLTNHDLHSESPLAWNQSYIRDPYYKKKPAIPQGYWMIDVQQRGEYEIELRRWPKEANLAMNATVPQQGIRTKWTDIRPVGIQLNFKKATLKIEGILQEQEVDMSKKSVKFKAFLSKGRQQMQAYFTNDKNEDLASFYLYITKK